MGLFQTMANNGNELLLLTLSRTNKEVADLKLDIRKLETRIEEASARIKRAEQSIPERIVQPLPDYYTGIIGFSLPDEPAGEIDDFVEDIVPAAIVDANKTSGTATATDNGTAAASQSGHSSLWVWLLLGIVGLVLLMNLRTKSK